MLEVAFLRSPHAHARIGNIDARRALEVPDVVAVYTLRDLCPPLVREQLPLQFPDAKLDQDLGPFVLARDEVVYVGEPIALVVAKSRYVAEDAAAQIDIAFEPLPVVADCLTARSSAAPLVHTARKSNVVAELRQSYGDIAGAFSGAHERIRVSLKQHRGGAHPIETRGAVAAYERSEHRLTVWSSTQLAHELRSFMMRMLDLDDNAIRIITPDVGGGFGAKYLVYAEEVALAAAAIKLRQPLKWIEDRREHFIAALQERDQHWDIEVACAADGRLLGVSGSLIHDQGAYTPQGINIPYNSATAFPGPYMLPAYDLQLVAVSTNKVPTSSVRGAGYPQGTFAMERCLDRIADRLGLDRVEVRRRNLIPAAQIPYATPLQSRSGSKIVFDSGDFIAILEDAVAEIDRAGFAERQGHARAQGRLIGLGVACGIKGTGRGPYESGMVRIGPSGRISVHSGAAPMGQGLKTTLAQICAEQFGLEPSAISVFAGDTAAVPYGMGGFASRQTVTAGSSVHLAACQVREKVLQIAAHVFEADVGDLEIVDGVVKIKGIPHPGLSLREVASVVYGSPGYAIPKGFTPGLESAETFLPKGLTYGMACHAVELEIDIGTCSVQINRYVVVNDSGTLINPDIVEGQIVGGVVHGIGNALFEWMGFDASGQPLTTTFAEYLLPTATEISRVDVRLPQYPSPLNPLGVKGVGESGTLPTAAAIVSAIESALNGAGLELDEIPISPGKLFALTQAAR